ncbi:MAG: BrnT family toxin [Chloroflexi bacterium]|nr:BrnT family toxin [Chloroflexota bacterium]
MPFEYDPVKSQSNHEKHDIAHLYGTILNGSRSPAKAMDELRWSVIGKIIGKHWLAVITYRADNVRNISVRRLSDEEIELYENI